jgi:hypothetical protein
MRILAGLAIVALGAGVMAGAASAQPGRLSDVAYVQAARCAGLASSGKLGGDGTAIAARLKSEGRGRQTMVQDQADAAMAQGRREADRAGEFSKAKLQAELTGACASLTS